VITGAHAILFSPAAEPARALLQDTLGLPWVDAGGGWPIYALPPAELAVHPADAAGYALYLMCDDIEATIAELEARGAETTGPVSDEAWGRVTGLKVPGGGALGLYEPRHPTAHQPPG